MKQARTLGFSRLKLLVVLVVIATSITGVGFYLSQRNASNETQKDALSYAKNLVEKINNNNPQASYSELSYDLKLRRGFYENWSLWVSRFRPEGVIIYEDPASSQEISDNSYSFVFELENSTSELFIEVGYEDSSWTVKECRVK